VRLAWFTPWPPDRSGIAGRSAEVVPALAAAGHGLDVFVDRAAPDLPPHADDPVEPGVVRVQTAHDFLWRARRDQYDLVVYQVGNSRLHEYMWPYLFRFPGLVVLHDARLHHARAREPLLHGRPDRYRAAFARNEPDVAAEAAELAVAGFDGSYYYLWPMVRDVVEAARTVAVHSRGAAAELAGLFPERPIEYLTLGEGMPRPPTPEERVNARRLLALPERAVTFGVFGALTAEKRLPEILTAFRACLAVEPSARLLLAGQPEPALDWRRLARAAGVERAVVFAGVLPDDMFDQAIAAVDVSLHLRWPTALETSGPWLRALSAARATVVIDLLHQAHLPAVDPRTWQPSLPQGTTRPATIAIDILDEAHSLALAFRRLALDRALRESLGEAGRHYWEAHHQFARMRDEYLDLMARAAARPVPVATAAALEYDPLRHARGLVADFGHLSCELF
jgi:glycosyltransferase involved in cell wall biosynthesis